jgi:hypothetical protein
MDMFHSRAAGRLAVLACAVLALLAFSSVSPAADVRYLWQSRDQFVALERQDSTSTGPAQPNDHPAELTLEKISAILTSIEMRASPGSKAEPLLTAQSVEVLAPYLQQAIRQSSPGQDVTFATVGLYSALYGLAKSPKVTTGRVFFKDGRLNIIVGLVQQDVKDRDDRRLFPFTPGSRLKAPEGEWALQAQPGQAGFSVVRKDWIAFGDGWRASVTPAPVAGQDLPAVPGTPVQPVKRTIETRSPADRLTTLNELKDKGLISIEEYREKRLEIFNGL